MAKKAQITPSSLPFVLIDSVTSTGKPCIIWDKQRSKTMVREDFLTLKHELAMMADPEHNIRAPFMFNMAGNPAFLGISKADLISLLRSKKWEENAPKEAKTAPAPVASPAMPAELQAVINQAIAAFMAAQAQPKGKRAKVG